MVRNSEWGQEDPTATDAERFGDIIQSTTPADAGEYDVVLLGEPYDGGTTGQPGVRDAPAAIRDALDGVETHHLDAGPVDPVGDLGTVAIPASTSVSTAREAVRETVDDLHDADTIPVIFGGSGSLTVANVAGLLEATAVADGGEQIEDLRSSSELRSDGGFGEDEESVGDVEHFDPTGDEDTTEDESEDSADSEAADGEETDETEQKDDSEVDEAGEDSDEAEPAADEEDTEDAEPESGTDDEEPEEDETAEDADEQEADETAEDDEQADDEQADEEEVAEDEDDEPGETDDEDDEQEADETAGEADETTETPGDEEATETAEVDETIESSDEKDAADDTEAESAVDDTAFAMPDSGAETDVIEERTASPDTETATSEAGSVGVISLDARLDCRPVDSGPTNRTGYRELFEAGVDALAVLGARHFESSTTEAEYLRDRNGMVVTAEEVGDDPVEAADRALGAMDEVEQIYVSIDLSVLDSAAAPGVSDPAPGGLSSRELFRVVRLLASDDRIAGFELVEAVPALDREGRTIDAAARTVAHAAASISQ